MTPYQKYAAKCVFWLIILPLLTIFCVCKYIDTLFPSAHAQGFSDASAPFLLSTSSLRKGLVGYWRLEEASGTRYDCSSKGNHLTDNNSVGQSTGIQYKCGWFTKTASQWLNCNGSASLDLTNNSPFTLTAWVLLTNLNNCYFLLNGDSNADASTSYALQHYNSRFYLTIGSNNVGHISRQCTTTTVTSNTWYFVVGTYNQSSAGISVNNNAFENSSYTLGSMATTNILAIGRSWPQAVYWNGLVDEVGIWKRVLTPKEITQLYNSGLGTHFPWAHR